MSDVIFNLRKFSFPEVIRSSLAQLEKCFAPKQESIGAEDLAEKIVDEFIFQQSTRRNLPQKKVTAVQELQIIEHVLQYFTSKGNDVIHQQVFRALFGGTNDANRLEVLSKMISMAIGIECGSLLNAAAVWMQLNGCSSQVVCRLCKKLVDDYFVLVNEVGPQIYNLPMLSTHFTCNFITAVSCAYNPPGINSSSTIPESLLKMISDWIFQDSRLCLATLTHSTQSYFTQSHRTALWTSPTKPNTQTPTPGLVRWCVQAPLYHVAAVKELNNKYDRTKKNLCTAKVADLERMNLLWSKLHLAVLETILQLPAINNAAQLELLTLIDMNRIIKEVVDEHRKLMDGDKADETLQSAVDRLVQVLQISLATGAFRCSLVDLRKIIDLLPPSPLTPVLERHHLSTAPPLMHNASI